MGELTPPPPPPPPPPPTTRPPETRSPESQRCLVLSGVPPSPPSHLQLLQNSTDRCISQNYLDLFWSQTLLTI